MALSRAWACHTGRLTLSREECCLKEMEMLGITHCVTGEEVENTGLADLISHGMKERMVVENVEKCPHAQCYLPGIF